MKYIKAEIKDMSTAEAIEQIESEIEDCEDSKKIVKLYKLLAKQNAKLVEQAQSVIRAKAQAERAGLGLSVNGQNRENAKLIKSKLDALIAMGMDKKSFFGYDTMTQLLIQLAFTIQFNKGEYRDDALMMSGAEEFTVNAIIDSIGINCKVDLENQCVTDGTLADVDVLSENLSDLAEQIGCLYTYDKSKVTDDKARAILENNHKYCQTMLDRSLAES